MREFYSEKRSFSDAPFEISLPKLSVNEPYIGFDFMIGFLNKAKKTIIVLQKIEMTDSLGNHQIFNAFDNNTNLYNPGSKFHFFENAQKLRKNNIDIKVCIITFEGVYTEVLYKYEGKNISLISVKLSNATSDEAEFFIKVISDTKTPISPVSTVPPDEQPKELPPNLEKIINAVYTEMYHIKNNGGRKYKVMDGRLISKNAREFCYSFELESELYLADDSPVALVLGDNRNKNAIVRPEDKVDGTVVVCSGFQIILSLERDMGKTIPVAMINAEPWKLLQKLNERLMLISPKDTLAWKLYDEGPDLAERIEDVSNISRGQEEVIKKAIDSDITVVWGPPGTGKTYTMANITKMFVETGKTVLIVSHSNISVDNVVKQISKQFASAGMSAFLEQGKVLRYGYVRDEELRRDENCVSFNFTLNEDQAKKKIYKSLLSDCEKLKIQNQYKRDEAIEKEIADKEKVLKEIRSSLKAAEKRNVMSASVVATTVSKLYMNEMFDNRKYDVVMFDEVSMAYVPQLICAATYATEKFICVGDFRQLAPIVQCEKAKDILEKDIFTYLNINNGTRIHNHPWLVMLNEQRRMHPGISSFSKARIYNGLLKDHESVIGKWDGISNLAPITDNAVSLIDLSGAYCAASKNEDNSRFNIQSAILSFAVALESERNQKNLSMFKPEEKVGIITPYAAQTRLMRALIQDYRSKDNTGVSCATVHQFQGSERNTIIFDAVESFPFARPGWLVAKDDNYSVLRLINVALTRARCKFITLANTQFWYSKLGDTYNTYVKLLRHISQYDNVISKENDELFSFINSLDFGRNIKCLKNDAVLPEEFFEDVKKAQKQIIISFPTDRLNPAFSKIVFDAIIKANEKGVAVYGKSKEIQKLDDDWKSVMFRSQDAVFPLVEIDGNTLWYGLPVSELRFEVKGGAHLAPKSPIFRIKGHHTIDMIHSLCDLDYRTEESGARIKLFDKLSKPNLDAGFSEYVERNVECQKCFGDVKLHCKVGWKPYLECKECGEKSYIPVEEVNKYITKNDVRCNICKGSLCAKIGRTGLYIRCTNGHFTNLSDI